MNEDSRLKDKYGRRNGFRIPEGYFETVYAEISAALPERPVERKVPELTRWQKMKPYLYLAAMFAGIWCMMKVFTDVSGGRQLSIDNPPENIAQLMVSDSDAIYQAQMISMPDIVAEDEVVEHYSDISDLEKDFGFELDPEYRNIDVEEIIGTDKH